MISFKKLSLQFLGGAATLVALGLAAPRAGHALAAALVQVTNTASNPVVTQSTNASASQLVLLQVPFNAVLVSGDEQFMRLLSPNGNLSQSDYVVPAGQNLVVTDVSLTAYDLPVSVALRSQVPGAAFGLDSFTVPANSTQVFRFTSGLVFPAGAKVQAQNTGNGTATVVFHGYLTAN